MSSAKSHCLSCDTLFLSLSQDYLKCFKRDSQATRLNGVPTKMQIMDRIYINFFLECMELETYIITHRISKLQHNMSCYICWKVKYLIM